MSKARDLSKSVNPNSISGDRLVDGAVVDSKVSSSADISAAKLSFLQDLTNTNAINLSDKVGEVVSVKSFGAAGDGATDDVNAINRALWSGAGKIFFPDGVYYVSAAALEAVTDPIKGLVVRSNTVIEFSGGAKILHEANADSRHIFSSGAGTENVTFINVNIDGNNSSTNGLGLNDCSHVRIIGGFIERIVKARPPFSMYSGVALGGGRGITFQSFKQDVVIEGITFSEVHSCIDISAAYPSVEILTRKRGAVTISNISAIRCENIVGCLAGASDYSPSVNPLNYNQLQLGSTVVDGVTFRNCGASSATNFTQVNLKWQDSTPGNIFPWASLARTGTSFSGQRWLVLNQPFDSTKPEWSPTATYNQNDIVKITDVGQLSALFTCDNTSSLSVSNVRGYNDTDYPKIGALYQGCGSNVMISDVAVSIEAGYLARLAPNPILNYFVRESVVPKCVFIDNVINFGTFDYLMDAEMPYSNNASTDFDVKQFRLEKIYATASNVLISPVGPNLSRANGNEPPNSSERSISILNPSRYGTLSGTANYVGRVDLSAENGGWNSTFGGAEKSLFLHGAEFRGYQFNPAVTFKRVNDDDSTIYDVYLAGNSAGTNGSVEVNGGLFIQNSAWNQNLLRLGTYRLWVDASGRLRIKASDPTSDTDGTVVGTQS